MTDNLGLALLFTTLAGLSTGIGSCIAYFIRKPKPGFLAFSLGISGGVMVYVSFVELLPEAMEIAGEFKGIMAFFLGIVFIGIIDLLVPEASNPHEYKESSNSVEPKKDKVLLRTGLLTALAIAIHNFPEGIAAFGASLNNLRTGFVIAMAIAIHNIPEGISVSVPIYYATGSRKKAFVYSFLSGLSEPVGAIVGFLILRSFLTETVMAYMLAAVAGIMVYISFDEILPVAHRYGKSHVVILGIVLGMLIMALSLVML